MKKVLLFVILIFSFQSYGSNFLKVYFFPTPYKFSWDSPQKLAKSVIKNTVLPSKYKYKSSIGHAAVEISCGDYFYDLTGMSMAHKNEDTQLVLKDKIGLGVMFYPMAGRLQSQRELINDINERIGTKDISWIKYQINDLTCHRLKTYLSIYRSENLDQVYGLVFNPRKKEGAGCSAFAVSFLEIAGLLTDDMKLRWSRNILTNKNLNSYNGTAQEVSLFKMALGQNSKKWASSLEDGIPLFFWEPLLMHQWVQEVYELEQERSTGLYHLERNGQSVGLFKDARMTIPDLGPLFY